MRRIIVSLAIVIVAVALVGCQQPGLSEEEIRGIVREEIAM